MIRHSPQYFNLTEASRYLGIGLSTAKRDWPAWEKYGVVPSRYGRNLIFNKSELDQMMEQLKVSK